MPTRRKRSTQVDSALLDELRTLARNEGREIQALVDEAVAALLEQRRQSTARPHVIAAHQRSHARFAALYAKLAK